MKTNVVLKSEDRKLYGITIRQQTGTGMLNLSDLQEAYDHTRIHNGWISKDISDMYAAKSTHERLFYIVEKQSVIKPSFIGFMGEIESEGLTKVLKRYGVYKTTGARKSKTTWCDPYIFVLFAMELNPKMYADVIFWVTDSLILNRIEAGTFYTGLSKAVSKFKDVDYVQMATGLNYIIFGEHKTGIRQTSSKKQLSAMADLEKKLAFAVDMGFVKSFKDLINVMRKMYEDKQQLKQII